MSNLKKNNRHQWLLSTKVTAAATAVVVNLSAKYCRMVVAAVTLAQPNTANKNYLPCAEAGWTWLHPGVEPRGLVGVMPPPPNNTTDLLLKNYIKKYIIKKFIVYISWLFDTSIN